MEMQKQKEWWFIQNVSQSRATPSLSINLQRLILKNEMQKQKEWWFIQNVSQSRATPSISINLQRLILKNGDAETKGMAVHSERFSVSGNTLGEIC
jgi:hypothetical protein